MFKILIADDEQVIRNGIISILTRNLDEELECIEASNGTEALTKAQERRPHLIITDISMPGCDGLEFIGRLQKEHKNIPIVILSGYDNFEYAQKAIRLGVKEYVMKPIKKQEFITLIHDYIHSITTQRVKAMEELTRKMESDRIMERLKHDFLLGILKCPTSEEAESYLIRLKEFGMEFKSNLYICAVIQYKLKDKDDEYMDFAAKNILDEYLSLQVNENVINVIYDKGQIVTIFEGSSNTLLQESKKRLIRKTVSLLKQYFKTDVFAGIGDISYNSVRLHISLRHAMLAADFKLHNPGDIVAVYDELEKESCKEPLNLVRFLRPVENINLFEVLGQLQKLMEQSQSKEAMQLLNSEYKEIQEYISIQILRHKKRESAETKSYRPLAYCWTFSEVKREVREQIELLQQCLSSGNQPNVQLSQQILQYVDEHITEEMDLNMIAEHFKRTPGYISTIFKTHAVGGFNSYLTKKRLEIAKTILRDSSIPIHQISQLSGFSNPKYFSVVFKKMLGETPREYRNRFVK